MSVQPPDPAPRLRARRLTLADDVYEAIKAQIVDHVIAPGERVNIDALARELTVSPTPVREALARLEADGLMRKRPMSGYTTTPLLTRPEFEQLFEMRALLEVPAAGFAARRVDGPASDRLIAAAELPATERTGTGPQAARRAPGPRPGRPAVTDRARYAAFTTYDARFHETVAHLSGNPMLAEAISRLHAHLHLHRLYLPSGPMTGTGAEHHRIAAAIVAGDPDGAREAMREHLTAARERHMVVFTATGGRDERGTPPSRPGDRRVSVPGEE